MINAGTLVISIMLLRMAILVTVPNTTERGLHLIERLTDPAVWPLQHVSLLDRGVIRGMTIADLLALILLIAAWLLALGIVAGWEHETQRQRPGTSETGLRP